MSIKILIAEDDENSRQLLEAILTSEGYEVESFSNGRAAWNHLRRQPPPPLPQLIISDILMPEMDGYSLCREVKQSPELLHIPFIFYTATYTSAQDERFALALGACRFAVKPMPMEELLTMLHEVFAQAAEGQLPQPQAMDIVEVEKLHGDRVRNKLDKKLRELETEREKLLESERRFRDYAEASADWFWETDDRLRIYTFHGGPAGLNRQTLDGLTSACHSHSPAEMLWYIQQRKSFREFVIQFHGEDGRLLYLRFSGKPVVDAQGGFHGYRGVSRDVTDTVSMSQRIAFLASHDELTGLPNRALFRERLDHAIAKAERNQGHVLLLFFDLDNFKLVNDTLGHEAGDQLLVEASQRIASCVRATDSFCRLGGDEFVLVMEDATPQDGHRLVRDIIDAFTTPFSIHGQPVYATVSIGVSLFPDDATDPQTLLTYADLAMYRAKQNGRNDFEFYTADLNNVAHQWLLMEQGLRQAMSSDQLFLAYQPQVDIATGSVVGAEALLRWRHPEHGMIPPAQFIPIAEQSNLIISLGEWVLNTLCRQIKAWEEVGLVVPKVSINISARHLRSATFQQALAEIPGRYDVSPSRICIEITEHVMLEDGETVRDNMEYIRSHGYYLSMDDFGMGHSSLVYLKRYAVNELKIDRSFVDGIADSEEDQVIVKAVIALADALGLTLVGEGVETEEQARILLQSGCRFAQGYYFARPMEAEKLETWLREHDGGMALQGLQTADAPATL